jgi:hypothetical protein
MVGFALAMWEAGEDAAYKALKGLGQEKRSANAGVVYKGGLAKGNASGDKTIRTLVRSAATGLLEDVTGQLAAVARPQQAEFDARALEALRAVSKESLGFSFTGGKHGLWNAWGTPCSWERLSRPNGRKWRPYSSDCLRKKR